MEKDKRVMYAIVDDFVSYCVWCDTPRTNPDYSSDCDTVVDKPGSYCPKHEKIRLENIMSKLTTDSKEFLSFFEGCKKISHDYCKRNGYKNNDEFSYKDGKKYIKIIRGDSVHSFVNKENGDVLKPAGWASPAKHARGNIFDGQNGLGQMGEFGPRSLR